MECNSTISQRFCDYFHRHKDARPEVHCNSLVCLVTDLLEVVAQLLDGNGGSTGLDGVIVASNDDALTGLDGNEATLSELGIDGAVISTELQVLLALDQVALSGTAETLNDGSSLGVSDGKASATGPLAAYCDDNFMCMVVKHKPYAEKVRVRFIDSCKRSIVQKGSQHATYPGDRKWLPW